MIRGISFKTLQTEKTVLLKIFKCINIEKYCWHNIESQNEVWNFENNSLGDIFFDSECYDGTSFLRRIHSNHYIIFLKLQAYFENGYYYDIHTYEDFQRSDCQLLLLISDCDFVEIYAKDPAISKSIYDNALSNNFTEVKYITDINDRRTRMNIL